MINLEKFIAEVKEKLKKAIKQFNSNFSADDVSILFNLKGTRAATASFDEVNGVRFFGLNFNAFNLEHDYDEICLALSGTGERTHRMKTKKARITKKYVYMIKEHKFTISSLHHKKVQKDELFFHVYIDDIQYAISPRHFTGEILRH